MTTYSIHADELVEKRLDEIWRAHHDFTEAMPDDADGCTGESVLRLYARIAEQRRAIDQLGAAVATRDGFGNCQSIGPDVLVQR
jgi:hypothetical protein